MRTIVNMLYKSARIANTLQKVFTLNFKGLARRQFNKKFSSKLWRFFTWK